MLLAGALPQPVNRVEDGQDVREQIAPAVADPRPMAPALQQVDGHWRNARTLSLHNPLDFKSMHAGDYLLNHRLPPVDSYN